MILEADDEGRFICDAGQLRAVTWAYHSRVTEAMVEAEIQVLASTSMVSLYQVGDTRYAVFPSWHDHQVINKPMPSRLPDNDGTMLRYPTEQDIRQSLYADLEASREFCGHKLLTVNKNVRIGSGYADLVVTTDAGIRIVVELKKTRADKGALGQIQRYCSALPGDTAGVVIASGLGANSGARDFKAAGIALITYDSSGRCAVVVPSRSIHECNGLSVREVDVIKDNPHVISQRPDCEISQRWEGKGKEGNGKELEGNGTENDTVGLAPDGAHRGSEHRATEHGPAALRTAAREILAFLNTKAERNYQPTSANLDLITARLREGATVTHCRAVISRKVREWKGDDKMHRYLRPETLFNRTKFAQYQGELPATAFALAEGEHGTA